MEVLWTKVCVALQHLPVAMSGDESDLLIDRPASNNRLACLMTQIMEVQIFDFQPLARAPKSRAHGPWIHREYSCRATRAELLLLKNFPGVKTRDIEQGNLLIVPALVPGVFSIPHDDNSILFINIVPADAADFILPHSCCHGETHHSSKPFMESEGRSKSGVFERIPVHTRGCTRVFKWLLC